jgi:hypothetical protein
MYLNDRDYFLTFNIAWVADVSRHACLCTTPRQQRHWMLQYLANLPFEAIRKRRRAMRNDGSVPGRSPSRESVRRPVGLPSEPMPEDGFAMQERFNRFSNGIADLHDMEVAVLTSIHRT